MKRILPEFKFQIEIDNYTVKKEITTYDEIPEVIEIPENSHWATFYAVPKNPEKYPWLREKYYVFSGDVEKDLERLIKETRDSFKKFTTTWTRHFIDPQEYKDLFANVDVDLLNKSMMSMLGLSEDFNPKFEMVAGFDKYNNVDEYSIKSEVNLALSNPLLLSAWRVFRIRTWHSWCRADKDGNISITMQLSFSYEHQGGGSNGAEFGRLEIYEDRVELKDSHSNLVHMFDLNV